jgi:hypothetical protein
VVWGQRFSKDKSVMEKKLHRILVGAGEYILVSALYLLATLYVTFPLVLHLSDYLAGPGQEAHVFIWNFWWFKKAIMELHQNPFYTDYVFYPEGESLFFCEIPVLYAFLSVPLQLRLNPFATYNVLMILSFILTGVGMYLLLKYLTRNRVAAFIGGCIFNYAPFHVAHAMGHFHFFAMEWVPFFVLYFLKFQESARLRHLALAALFLSLAAANTLYYLLYGAVFAGLHFVFFAVKERNWRVPLKRTLLILLAAGVFLAPKILPMFSETLNYDFVPGHNPETNSADLLSFFIPNEFQTIGRWFVFMTSRFTSNSSENSNYLGYAVIFLSAVAFLKLRKKNKLIPFFIFSAVAFWILSLGMHLHVAGRITPLPLPYMIGHKFVPGFSFSGSPQRIHVMTMFCLAIVTAFAIKELLFSKARKAKLVLVAVMGLLALEYLSLPFPLSPTYGRFVKTFCPPLGNGKKQIPKIYFKMAEDNEDYAILDVVNAFPYDMRRVEVLYYQTIHNKKMLGGILSRNKLEKVNKLMTVPVLSEILLNKVASGMSTMPCEWRKEFARKVLAKENIRYVIVPQQHGIYPKNQVPEFYALCKIYDAEGVSVYQSCENSTCSSLSDNEPE